MKKIYKIIGTDIIIALLSWLFFKYVDYVLNVITPDSFSFDFEPVAMINFIFLGSLVSLALAVFRAKRWALAMAGVVGLVFGAPAFSHRAD